ncbi:MAG: cytochrome b/b6 domain-containing protein [Amaricoccus sp.]|uniref:cytochrome b n=1 Tax=Amaricoccus sp. TaxID=1872485 RepID=UPI0039E3A85B
MRYGRVSRLFHWITVLLILVMIPVGLTMIQEIPRPLQDRLFVLHKGLGPVVLLVVVLRLGWRAFHPAPPLPADLPRLQRGAAAVVHAGLYLLLLVMATSGYVRVTTGGYPIEALNALGIPPLFGKHETVSAVAKTVHATALFALLALIAAHIGAAVWHGLVRRDGIVRRMWPPL